MSELAYPKFAIGDKVSKPKGYPWPGVVVAVFHTMRVERRYCVERVSPDGTPEGCIHIFSETQLERRT